MTRRDSEMEFPSKRPQRDQWPGGSLQNKIADAVQNHEAGGLIQRDQLFFLGGDACAHDSPKSPHSPTH